MCVSIADKVFDKGQIYGGVVFGIGWAITGALSGAAVRADRSRLRLLWQLLC